DRDRSRAAVAVVAASQGEQVVTQRLAPWWVQRFEGAERRAVVGAEEVDVFLGAAEAEDGRAAVAGHGGGDIRKERVEVALIAPADGRLKAGPGGQMAREDTEGLADEPVGGPARQRDAPARPADPGQLGRGPVVVGGEHDPVDRDHSV